MALTRRLFLAGIAAFMAYRPKPTKSVYANPYASTY